MVRLSALFHVVFSGVFMPAIGHAQAIGPDEIEAIGGTIAKSIETMVILGGDNGINGGKYTFDTNSNSNLRIIKGGASGPVTRPKPMGWKGLEWAPLLIINGGYLDSDHVIAGTTLAGNETETKTYAGELGTGARFKLTPNVSVAPKLSLIYGRTNNEFTANNQAGIDLENFQGGQFVDWTLNSMTVSPAFDLKLDWDIGRAVFEFVSDYRYFHIWSFGETSPVVSLDGSSHTWNNSIDIDVPLGWKVVGRELHVGAAYDHWSLFGDIEQAMNAGYAQGFAAHVALDFTSKFFQTRWVGLGGRYFWGPNFSGWGVGLNVRMAF